ncbi:MAG: DUF11 domain-containing protein [Candidatus Eisenbacteria sp.]|nr:DUF11 domain-containing protein [Candidatus Eisenbacteria bacterium]
MYSEPDYDFLVLQYEKADVGFVTLDEFDGYSFVNFSYNVTFNPGDYTGPAGNEVHLRWTFASDGQWSDEDCLWPSQGAVSLDDIEVQLDNNGDVQVFVEDCEDGISDDWQPVAEPGIGDFAQVWAELDDADPCRNNPSPVVAFIDDGYVVPGTGGSSCITHCYGPHGLVVNSDGGLGGEGNHLHNEVRSPALQVPFGHDGAMLKFDVYTHETLSGPASAGVFYVWHVRSSADSSAATGWSEWRDRNFVYYGGPEWRSVEEDISDLLEPGALWAQVALGAYEFGYVWGFDGADASPAPYFDNVEFLSFEVGGPSLIAREIDLAQDAFPENGSIDYAVPENNWVRFDMARTLEYSSMDYRAGDSLLVRVAYSSGALWTAELRYVLSPNSLYNDVRVLPPGAVDLGATIEGSVTCQASGDPSVWFADLPDSNLLFPGDVVHYYFAAQDILGLSFLPQDTTGLKDFSYDSAYPSTYTFRALPSMEALDPGAQPSILLWNDNANRGGESEWKYALAHLGYLPGLGGDYDIYYTNGPTSAVGNGLGGRANAPLLSGYETILYTCGDLTSGTINGGGHEDGLGSDVAVLRDWLGQQHKHLLLTGDNLVSDLHGAGSETDGFRAFSIGVELDDSDLRPQIDNQTSPTVHRIPGNSVFSSYEEWFIDGGCYSINTFDAVLPIGETERLAEFADPAGASGAYSLAAATRLQNPSDSSDVVYLPYDLSYVRNASQGGKAAPGAALLGDILSVFGYSGTGPPSGVPDLSLSTAECLSIERSIFSLPDGAGTPLGDAYQLGGQRAGGGVVLTLRDDHGDPVADYPAAQLQLKACGGSFVTCGSGVIADSSTSVAGRTTLGGPLRAGGSDGYSGAAVYVDGDSLLQSCMLLPYWFNSPDINADLQVSIADLALLAGDLNGVYDYRSDFYWDGILNLSDVVLFDYGYGRTCSTGPARKTPFAGELADEAAFLAGETRALPPATIGIYFDSLGTIQSIAQEVPEQVKAWVLLTPSDVAGVRGAAWTLDVSPPSVLIWEIRYGAADGRGIAVGAPDTGVEHGIGYCETARGDRPVVLATMMLRPMEVLDVELNVLAHGDYGGELVYADCRGELSEAGSVTATEAATIEFPSVADLEVAKRGPSVAYTGGGVTYSVTLTNNGPDGATGVEVTDLVPPALNLGHVYTSTGTYDEGTGIWSVGLVAESATETLNLFCSVHPESTGTLINVATITASDQDDVNPVNDVAIHEVTILPGLYVSQYGDDTSGDGTAGNPYRTIQKGLDMASPGQYVVVRSGLYSAGTNGEVFPIQMRDGRHLISDGSRPRLDAEHSESVFECSSLSLPTSIEMLQVEDGDGTGGGFDIQGCNDLTIRECWLWSNGGGSAGGGIFCSSSTVALADCRIEHSSSYPNPGGAIYAQSCTLAVSGCEISENDGYRGGAACCYGGTASFDACDFTDNGASYGIIYGNNSAQLSLSDCSFTMGNGPKIYLEAGADATLSHCTMTGISVGNALCAYVTGYGATIAFHHCTLAGNPGTQPVIALLSRAYGSIENCIIADNGGTAVMCLYTGTAADVACSDIWGNAVNWAGCIVGDAPPNEGNLELDPLFCDPGAGDYNLAVTSPCAPGNHPEGGGTCPNGMGALPVTCEADPGTVHVDPTPDVLVAPWSIEPGGLSGTGDTSLPDMSPTAYTLSWEAPADDDWLVPIPDEEVLALSPGSEIIFSGEYFWLGADEDVIAFSTTQDNTGDSWLAVAPLTSFSVHVIVLNPGHPLGIGAWECRIVLPGNIQVLDYVFAPGSFGNLLTPPEFLVGVNPALPSAPAVWLMTLELMMFDDQPATFLVESTDPSSVSPPAPAYAPPDGGSARPLTPASGAAELPIFVVNPTTAGVVTVSANVAGAPFKLRGPYGHTVRGAAPSSTANAPAGTYILTWENLSGYASPEPVQIVGQLSDAGTLDFEGVYEGADVSLTKTVDVSAPAEGAAVTFTVTALNNGPSSGTHVLVEDQLPVGLEYDSYVVSAGTFTPPAGNPPGPAVWSLSSLPTGNSETLEMTVIAAPGTGGSTLTNAATVTAMDQSDPESGNNTASEDVMPQSSGISSDGTVPTAFALYQSRPNPGGASVAIRFDLPEARHVTLRILDVTGRVVGTPLDEHLAPGSYTVPWEPRDMDGVPLPSGVYLYRLRAKGFAATGKMLLTR